MFWNYWFEALDDSLKTQRKNGRKDFPIISNCFMVLYPYFPQVGRTEPL